MACTPAVSAYLPTWSWGVHYITWTCNILSAPCCPSSNTGCICNQFLSHVLFICTCSISKPRLKHLGTDGKAQALRSSRATKTQTRHLILINSLGAGRIKNQIIYLESWKSAFVIIILFSEEVGAAFRGLLFFFLVLTFPPSPTLVFWIKIYRQPARRMR